ncbi:unnamed protein product, partial [Larinioides sclopetarius]
ADFHRLAGCLLRLGPNQTTSQHTSSLTPGSFSTFSNRSPPEAQQLRPFFSQPILSVSLVLLRFLIFSYLSHFFFFLSPFYLFLPPPPPYKLSSSLTMPEREHPKQPRKNRQG